MRRIDLHAHSTCSDGEWSPTRLVETAAAEGVGVLALTDHDTVAGVAEAAEVGRRVGVCVVPGIELSVTFVPPGRRGPGEELHVLGYFVRPDAPSLAERLARDRALRDDRNARLVARLAALGAPVDVERVRQLAGPGTPGRPHVARALVEAGHARDLADAFQRYLAAGAAGWVDRERISAGAGITLLRAAGAVPVLAHPAVDRAVTWSSVERTLSALKDMGLLGVEVWHPAHDAVQRQGLALRARRLGLVPTGGSDFHGPGTRPDIRLGRGRGDVSVPEEAFDALRALRPPAAPGRADPASRP